MVKVGGWWLRLVVGPFNAECVGKCIIHGLHGNKFVWFYIGFCML